MEIENAATRTLLITKMVNGACLIIVIVIQRDCGCGIKTLFPLAGRQPRLIDLRRVGSDLATATAPFRNLRKPSSIIVKMLEICTLVRRAVSNNMYAARSHLCFD